LNISDARKLKALEAAAVNQRRLFPITARSSPAWLFSNGVSTRRPDGTTTLFSSLTDTRHHIKLWNEDYNVIRPHSLLGNLTPREYAQNQHLHKAAA